MKKDGKGKRGRGPGDGLTQPRNIQDVLDRCKNMEHIGDGIWTADCPVPGCRGRIVIVDFGDRCGTACLGWTEALNEYDARQHRCCDN